MLSEVMLELFELNLILLFFSAVSINFIHPATKIVFYLCGQNYNMVGLEGYLEIIEILLMMQFMWGEGTGAYWSYVPIQRPRQEQTPRPPLLPWILL